MRKMPTVEKRINKRVEKQAKIHLKRNWRKRAEIDKETKKVS